MTLSDKQFTEQFEIKTDDDIKQIVKYLDDNDVTNIEELKTRINVIVPLEYCYINIDLSETFKLEDIPDEILVKLFHNVENKLLGIGGRDFIIVHRVSDDKIFKK